MSDMEISDLKNILKTYEDFLHRAQPKRKWYQFHKKRIDIYSKYVYRGATEALRLAIKIIERNKVDSKNEQAEVL